MSSSFKQIIFTALFIMYASISFSQDFIQGVVYSASDSTALIGASVYFDGTSIGVSTNIDGEFKIRGEGTTSPLVISMIGHQTLIVPDYADYNGKLPPIYLQESQERLGEVHLETDPWTRKKKLGVFRREFLGNNAAALKCNIENEDALHLRYIPSQEVMVAYASEPLIITNRHLDYEVTYNLTDFRVEFSTGTSGLQFTHLVYYEGLSFFKELRKSTPKRIFKNRNKAYTGSTLHFMRSLASKKLHQNNFRIFHKRLEVPPYDLFNLETIDNLVQVELLSEKLTILHRDLDQSSMETSGKFYIDPLGNHTPPQNVIFSGEISRKRMAEMLPMDYQIIKENPN